ncbi:DUF2975 domain-containing protein [Cellulomonas alba]|uniref:DUF2975 domain-containing protein n=1 Tax=Cellulomonas alba TaxID=3053467 RepID=A0ABT7SFU3_9CELL|nr:DUF2975 domain-containing protein [Cellulomonas alba]MDM7855050.1 DUF2975 domain-containing protein [Cellulomonas alba]
MQTTAIDDDLRVQPNPARARVVAGLLEATLWVLLAVVIVTQVVRPLVGPSMLGIGQGPYWGMDREIRADLSPDVWARAAADLGGTLPAALARGLGDGEYHRGEAVESTLPNSVEIQAWDPDLRQTAGLGGSALLTGVVVAVALALALLVVRDLRRGRLFRAANLRRVYAAAVVVGFGGMLAQVLGAWGRVGILESPRLAGYVEPSWSVSFVPLVVGLTLAGGAEVLRLGVRMQRDVEGLV